MKATIALIFRWCYSTRNHVIFRPNDGEKKNIDIFKQSRTLIVVYENDVQDCLHDTDDHYRFP